MAMGKKKRRGAGAASRAEAAPSERRRGALHEASGRRGRAAGSASARRVVPALDPFAEVPPQPGWVAREFPAYVEGSHVSGPASSTRVLHTRGHHIEITTTYSVTLDGRPIPVHLLVDSDGRLWSHLCPYRTFSNATDLIAYLVAHAPEALTELHGGHGEHGEHERGAPEPEARSGATAQASRRQAKARRPGGRR